jgi:magnesium-protoporphyrin IX monomethyl ester (oxidative) cyclase
MKILLINPLFSPEADVTAAEQSCYLEPPLGILYLSGYLKKHLPDVAVEVLDVNLSARGCPEPPSIAVQQITLARVKDFNPDLVGISALYYAGAPMVHETAALVKGENPDIVVAVGGSYPTHLPDRVLEDHHIDFAVAAEGESPFLLLARLIQNHMAPGNIPGVQYRRRDATVDGGCEQRRFIDDLDTIPWPDREAVPMGRYYAGRNVLRRFFPADQHRIGSLVATRGCPHQCTFCGSKKFWGRQIRFRDPDRVVDEMVHMNRHYGTDLFVFNDDNFSADKKRFHRLMDEIERRLPGIGWCSGGGISARSINDELTIQRMYETGVVFFNLAIESGRDATLKKIKKPLTTAEAANVVDLIRKHGNAYITGFFILGFPFETLDDIASTIDFARQLDLDWSCFYNLHPFPGSEIYDACIESGLIREPDIYYKELYNASNIRYSGYTAEDIVKINYDANIDINFIHNRNQNTNPGQALRDFDYVMGLSQGHLMACYMKGKTLAGIGRAKEALSCFRRIQTDMSEGDPFYPYFKKYRVDIEREIRDVTAAQK